MSSRKPTPRRRKTTGVVSADTVVVVCRGGDCGSRTKHPGTDHTAQLQALRDGVDPASTSVIVSSCLDACDQSNVVVVLPGQPGRRVGGGPVWIGGVLDSATTLHIIDWVRDGGPAVAEEPVLVGIRAFQPSRLNRHELDEVIEVQ